MRKINFFLNDGKRSFSIRRANRMKMDGFGVKLFFGTGSTGKSMRDSAYKRIYFAHGVTDAAIGVEGTEDVTRPFDMLYFIRVPFKSKYDKAWYDGRSV